MLFLSGFELYSRWVPLTLTQSVPLALHRTSQLGLELTELWAYLNLSNHLAYMQ